MNRMKMQVRRGRKVVKHCVVFFNNFSMFCGPGRSKNSLSKAAGAEPSG